MYTHPYMENRQMQPATIGDRLKRIREKRGLTQEDVARTAGLESGKQAIYNWEKGARKPDADNLAALARALLTTSDYLLGLTDDDRPLPERLTDEEVEVLTFWHAVRSRGK